MIRVEAVDAQTAPDDTLNALHAVEAACAVGPFRTADEAVGFMRHPPGGDLRLHWLALAGEEPIGMARLRLPPVGLPWLNLNVLEAHRRRGVGRALLETARGAAQGRPLGAHHATEAGAAFARAVGARDEHRDVRSVLALPVELAEAPLPPGYRLRSWAGAAPADIVESFAVARNAIADSPAPEDDVFVPWTVESVRGLEEAIERRGRELRVTVALAGETVAAFTELRVTPGARAASTEDTATVPEHRRRGLCRAAKIESLRLLQRDRPSVEAVDTLNAEENTGMRAINTKLGFVPVVTLTTAVLRVP